MGYYAKRLLILTNNESIVGFRMPDNQIALDLINKVGSPIATSSANKSGELSGVNIEDIKDIFKEEVDFYIDGGKSKLGIASTIVSIFGSKRPVGRMICSTIFSLECSLS